MGDKTFIPRPNKRVKRLNDIAQAVKTQGSISIWDAIRIAGMASKENFKREGYITELLDRYSYIRLEDGHLVFDREEYESYKASDEVMQAERAVAHEFLEKVRQAAPANGGDSS